MFYIEQGLELFSTCITLNLIVGMELHGLGVKSEDSKSSLATFRIFFFFFFTDFSRQEYGKSKEYISVCMTKDMFVWIQPVAMHNV